MYKSGRVAISWLNNLYKISLMLSSDKSIEPYFPITSFNYPEDNFMDALKSFSNNIQFVWGKHTDDELSPWAWLIYVIWKFNPNTHHIIITNA